MCPKGGNNRDSLYLKDTWKGLLRPSKIVVKLHCSVYEWCCLELGSVQPGQTLVAILFLKEGTKTFNVKTKFLL